MDPAAPPNAEREEPGNGGARDTIRIVADGIVFGIRSGQMVPGQHLAESDLTKRFGISRGSLREALKQLASDGIVTLSRFRGAYISALDRTGVLDLLDVLEPLCMLAARLAAENCRSDEIKAELKTISAELSRGTGSGRATYLELRHEFYDRLVAMGGNTELGRVIPLARTDLFRAQFDSVQTREQEKRHAAGYSKIAEAVAVGCPAKAERAVKKHFVGTRETLAVLPDHAFPVSPG